MAIIGQTLADGQLPNAKSTLYTAAAITFVRFMRLVNATGGAITVNIYIKRAISSSRRIIAKDTSLAAGASLDVLGDSLLSLSIGDLIEGDASAATSVDYLISGGI